MAWYDLNLESVPVCSCSCVHCIRSIKMQPFSPLPPSDIIVVAILLSSPSQDDAVSIRDPARIFSAVSQFESGIA